MFKWLSSSRGGTSQGKCECVVERKLLTRCDATCCEWLCAVISTSVCDAVAEQTKENRDRIRQLQ